MNDRIPKDHSQVYLVMKEEADRLNATLILAKKASGRCADDMVYSVRRGCSRLWDVFLVELLDPNGRYRFDPDDVRAAIVRLKDGKHLLAFHDTIEDKFSSAA